MTFANIFKRFSLATAMVLMMTSTTVLNSYAADTGVRVTNSRFLPSNPSQTKLSFVRLPHMASNQIAIRAASSVTTSGCDQFVSARSSTKVEGQILSIYLQAPTLVNTSQPRHPEYECSGKATQAFQDIVLTKWLLKENNITTISFLNEEYGLRKDFLIKMTGTYIEMYPASSHDAEINSFQAQNLAQNTNALKFWFYPQNTVILYVPMADAEKDLSKEVAALAKKKGLKPLNKELLGFTKPVTNPNYFYYVAANSEDAVTDQQETKKLGTIQTTKTVYGLMDDEVETKELDVFMKAPGFYE